MCTLPFVTVAAVTLVATFRCDFCQIICKDVSSDAARGGLTKDSIFLGVVLPCAAIESLNISGASIQQLLSAYKQYKDNVKR